MLNKKVKEYSGRKRIDINKSDGLNHNEDVIIFTVEEYQEIKADIWELKDKLTSFEKENELLKNQEQNLKEIIQNVTAPIYENHEKELEKKDLQIDQLTDELNKLKAKCNQFNLELMGLNGFEMLILRKHKRLINDFSSMVTIGAGQDTITVADDGKMIAGKKE